MEDFTGFPNYVIGNLILRIAQIIKIVLWCNGNTTDFESVFSGSNPERTSKKGSHDPILTTNVIP